MFEFIKLGSIATLTVGYVGNMTQEYTGSGVPFLRSLNIKPFHISESDIRYISEEFNMKIKKSILRENDVVIVRTGIPGTCCVVPKEYDGCNCSDIVIVHPDKTKVNPDYLAAYINVWGQKQISNNKVGAIQQHFNVRTAEDMLIALPPLKEQKKIAEIIKNINQKIFLNQKINDNLEQQIEYLYNYWFLQYNFPNQHNMPYKSSGGKIIYNNQLKKGIPENWAVVTLNTLCDILSGYSFQSNDYVDNGKYRLITIKNVQDSGVNLNVDNYINILPTKLPDYCMLKPENILMSLTGNVARVGLMYDNNCLLNQRVALVKPKKAQNNSFLYALFKSDTIRITLESLAIGTSQKNLSPIDAGNICIPYNESVVSAFSDFIEAKIKLIVRNLSENLSLCELRDWLLPMLMNGQATLDD